MNKYFNSLFIALLFLSLPGWSQPLPLEIQSLQKEFLSSQGYPIIIADKEKVRSFLQQKGLLEGASENNQAKALQEYYASQVNLTEYDAINLVPYFTSLNNAATSLPFFEIGVKGKTKCFVLPSGVQLSHEDELKRILGVTPETEDLYSKNELKYLQSLLTLEQLQLFSLYHELSHCLDPFYTVKQGTYEISAHDIHEAESFAEINALLMLQQRKKWVNIAWNRALLRGFYSLKMGPYLAAQPGGLAGPTYTQGGSIYFLSDVITGAQNDIEEAGHNINNMTTDQLVQFSLELTQKHVLSSRTLMALHNSFVSGSKKGLQDYLEMSEKHPDLFLEAYKDLKRIWKYFNFLPKLVESKK